MKRFWLCIFLIACIPAFSVTRTSVYGSKKIKSDAKTSATDYVGIPKKFKNGKVVEEQPAETAPAKETEEPKKQEEPKEPKKIEEPEEKKKPEIVLPERTDDESQNASSAMRFLPESFEYIAPAEPSEAILPDENANEDNSKVNSKMLDLPKTFEKEEAAASLPDENADEDNSKVNSKMLDLPKAIEKEEAAISLPDENADEDSSKVNSKMLDLPKAIEKEEAAISLPDENADEDSSKVNSKMLDLPKAIEKDEAAVSLPEENADEDSSKVNSKMLDLPKAIEKEEAAISLPEENADEDSSKVNSKMLDLPKAIEMTRTSVMLQEENSDEDESKINSKMLELPLPNALPEDDKETGNDLPLIWEDDSEEESNRDNFHDEDLPTLIDGADAALDENKESEWVFKKDNRRLMDFYNSFDGFPKSENDVFDNPAQYQYDDKNLVIESDRKIDSRIGKLLFDSAVNYVKSNEADKAVKLLKELLHYNFSVPETEHLLALAEFKSGNTDEAVKYLNRSLRKYKNPYLRAENMQLLGEINFSQKKYNDAYRNFMAAVVGVNPKRDAELYNKAGIAALRAGDIEKARKAWKTGKYLGNSGAKHNLIWLDN